MKKSIGIIGCSNFGLSLITSLSKFNDIEILAIDSRIEAITKAANIIKHAYLCDPTSEDALREVGMQNVDEVVVAIGQSEPEGLVNTIISTIMLKRIGINKITLRLDDPSYESILKTLGATNFINPMKVACDKVANTLAYENIVDYFDVAGQYTIYEIILPDTFRPLVLCDLRAKAKFETNIILVNRNKKTISPSGSTVLQPNDQIYIFSEKSKINKIVSFFNNYV